MTHDPVAKEMKKEGKVENHKGWKQESAGQAKKWVGAVAGDEVKEEEGKEEQMEGNAMKHEGKAKEHLADAHKELVKAGAPKA